MCTDILLEDDSVIYEITQEQMAIQSSLCRYKILHKHDSIKNLDTQSGQVLANVDNKVLLKLLKMEQNINVLNGKKID